MIQDRSLVLSTGYWTHKLPRQMVLLSGDTSWSACRHQTLLRRVTGGGQAQEMAHRPQRWEDALVDPTQQLNHPYTVLESNHPEITLKTATSIVPFHKTNPRPRILCAVWASEEQAPPRWVRPAIHLPLSTGGCTRSALKKMGFEDVILP